MHLYFGFFYAADKVWNLRKLEFIDFWKLIFFMLFLFLEFRIYENWNLKLPFRFIFWFLRQLC